MLKNYMYNPSTYNCKRNKKCEIGKYLNLSDCACMKHALNNLGVTRC